MVTTRKRRRGTSVVLSPNFSMSWHGNLYLLAGISLWCVLIGIGFWAIGAWLVLPFVGLELACLGWGLWFTQRKLQRKEVLAFSEHQIVFVRGAVFPQVRVKWRREAVRGQVLRVGHPLQSPEIALYDSSGRHCRIGAFLNKADSDLLIVFLREQGIHLRTESEALEVAF